MSDVVASQHTDISLAGFRGYEQWTIKAGYKGAERIVPPAGEDHAFYRDVWRREIIVSVSPTGRSVRVWVDGTEVPLGEGE